MMSSARGPAQESGRPQGKEDPNKESRMPCPIQFEVDGPGPKVLYRHFQTCIIDHFWATRLCGLRVRMSNMDELGENIKPNPNKTKQSDQQVSKRKKFETKQSQKAIANLKNNSFPGESRTLQSCEQVCAIKMISDQTRLETKDDFA